MTELNRGKALLFLSMYKALQLTTEQRPDIIMDIVEEFDDNKIDSSDYTDAIINYYQITLTGVSNSYLEKKLLQITDNALLVVGAVEILRKCPCCNFKTLRTTGEYEICRVCYWEDDGIILEEQYSNVNRMSLKEAKQNFINKALNNPSIELLTMFENS